MDSLGFLTDLLELWHKYGEAAKDLIPIIKRIASEIAAEKKQAGETDTAQTRRVLGMAGAERDELDVLLAADAASVK